MPLQRWKDNQGGAGFRRSPFTADAEFALAAPETPGISSDSPPLKIFGMNPISERPRLGLRCVLVMSALKRLGPPTM